MIDRNKANTSIKATRFQAWGCKVARDLFAQKRIIPQRYFDCVHWNRLCLVMKYNVWVTKHASGTSNRHLSKMDPRLSNICSCCGHCNESILHLTRCTNEGRWLMFDQTTTELIQWMVRSHNHQQYIPTWSTEGEYRWKGYAMTPLSLLNFPSKQTGLVGAISQKPELQKPSLT